MIADRPRADLDPAVDGQASPKRARDAPPEDTVSIDAVPGELRRIADLIEAAVVVAPLNDITTAFGLTSLTELSPRQWEIVRRLVEGERVTSIAAAMFLSRSTVRNHLSAIFAKVGVHSQEELVALYRRPGHVEGRIEDS